MNNHQAIYNTHPEVKSIRSDGAYDNERNLVELNDALVQEELAKLQAEYDAKAYQRTRAAAYEEVKEQLDQLYHDMTAGKLDATGEWHKAIKAVKDATPKP